MRGLKLISNIFFVSETAIGRKEITAPQKGEKELHLHIASFLTTGVNAGPP